MLEELKQRVFAANQSLKNSGLVVLTWGNVSGYDPASQLVVIKPSGVPYESMKPEDMVVVDLDGNVVEGNLRPSSDTPTHLCLYRANPKLGGIVHTHSTYATAFAQANREIPIYGTTHADAFYGRVPCVRLLTDEEIDAGYEANTGKAILEAFEGKDMLHLPAATLHGHGVFAWGISPEKAVESAITLEEVAKMAYLTEQINPNAEEIPNSLLEKHFQRKHGKNAYYGQKK